MIRLLVLATGLVLAACAPVTTVDTPSRTMIAETSLPPMKTFSARAPRAQTVPNARLTRDFLDLSFQMESGRTLPVMTRFEGPITVRVTGRRTSTLMPDLRALLKRLNTEARIPISLTDGARANITIEAVPRAAIQRVLPQAACFVAPNVSSLSEFRSARRAPRTNWANLRTRERLVIILPSDVSPQEIRDCLHEELAQALGPLNDLYRLPDSVFNDDNVHTVLTSFDMLILRATYAPDLASGMTREQVAERLPSIFARIHPQGRGLAAPAVSPTPQSYIKAIQAALGPGVSLPGRRLAARDALSIAQDAGWNDNRLGFAYYAQGRVLQLTDAEAAYRAFQRADAVYARSRATRLHRAFVGTHLAAYALANGAPAQARRLTDRHIPRAQEAQNAALLATLQMIRAEALQAEGRVSEAATQRLDSLGWARYGFGPEWAVKAKIQEVASLSQEPPV